MKPARKEVIDAFAAAEYARHFSPENEPLPLGVMEALRLMDKREFIFRGRSYRVPPVPWKIAAEMLDVREKLRHMKPEAPLPEMIVEFTRVARLSKLVCRPAGFVRRMFWRITPNPFMKATPWEVGKHLGFFSMCIGLDRELPSGTAPEDGRQRGMSRMTSLASSNISLHGRIVKASQSPGATS